MRKTALITGVIEQYVSCLSEFLIEKGKDVYCNIRRSSVTYRERTVHHPHGNLLFHLHYGCL